MAVYPPTDYLRRRMEGRGITEAEIDEGIGNPSVTYPSETHDDRTVILADLRNGRRLKIVVLTVDPERVITVADRDVER